VAGKIKARLRHVAHADGDRIGLKSPYNQALVDEIKKQIPHHLRKWDASLKGWFFPVSAANLEVLCQLLDRLGYEVVQSDTSIFPELADAGGPPPPPASVQSPPPRQPKQGGGKPAGAAAADDRFYSRRYASAEDYAVLYLLEGVPLPVAKVVYRALMGMSHPDQGGSAVDAQRVNVAWQRIEKSLSEES
jgi:hypothetical protein